MTGTFIASFIIIGVLAGFILLLHTAGGVSYPLIVRMRERGIRPKPADILLCRKLSFVPARSLMSHREGRFLEHLTRATDNARWRLCPHVRVADIVNVSGYWKNGSREWWLLHNLVSRWHCDVVVVDRHSNRVVLAIELDDRSHDAKARQRRDLLLEEVLRQAEIPLLRSRNEQELVTKAVAFLKRLRAGGETHHDQ